MTRPIRYELAGKWYARTGRDMVASLFSPGGTANGLFKRRKNGVALYGMDGKLRAFIVSNTHGERFAVTAYEFQGRPRYMHGLTEADRQWLGLPDSLGGERAAIDAAGATLEARI